MRKRDRNSPTGRGKEPALSRGSEEKEKGNQETGLHIKEEKRKGEGRTGGLGAILEKGILLYQFREKKKKKGPE